MFGAYAIADSGAEMPFYEDLDAVAAESELIVVGHAIGEQDVYEARAGSGTVIDSLGRTSFQVERILKGSIPIEHTIEVMEHGRIEQGLYYTVSGYVKMNLSDAYLLFLRNTGENTYAITGIYQGKFNLDNVRASVPFTANRITDAQPAGDRFVLHRSRLFIYHRRKSTVDEKDRSL